MTTLCKKTTCLCLKLRMDISMPLLKLFNLRVSKIMLVLPVKRIRRKLVPIQVHTRWLHKHLQSLQMLHGNNLPLQLTKLKPISLQMTFSRLLPHYLVQILHFNHLSDLVTYRSVFQKAMITNWLLWTTFRNRYNPEIAKINWTNKTKNDLHNFLWTLKFTTHR